MFFDAGSFNGGDLSAWNTSNVGTMARMFHGAILFNGDLSAWKTGNVTNMDGMFEGATRMQEEHRPRFLFL